MKEKQVKVQRKPNGKKNTGGVQVEVGQRVVLTIKRLGINGEGIGYYRRKITFIAGVLPGEKIQAEITKVHPKYLQAQVIKILSKSPDRVKPRDKYDVGGIELEHLCYDKQLEYKRDVILQALEKFKPRGYQNYDLRPTLGMENPYAYRNKAQFQVRRAKDGHLMAGLYRSNSHFLVDLPTFSTQKPLTMKIMRTVLKLLEKWQISAYNEKTNRGDVKTIVVRESQAKKEAQVVLITRNQRVNNLSAFVGDLQVALPEVVSIMQNINPEKTSLIWGAETLRLAGSEYLEETLGDVHFRLSARAFFQLNPSQTEVLYDQVKLALDLQADESLVDAYCGVGTIGLYVSKEAREVRGMDITPEAIVDARYNAQISGRTNVTYEVGPAEEWLPKWNREGFHPDALVVDPPRLGLDDKLIATILANPPKKFVYVSCNPSTLARDLVKLGQVYEVEYIQSVDMFPQTARCEAVVKFRRRKK